MCNNSINLNTIFQDPLFILLCLFDLFGGYILMILNGVEKPKELDTSTLLPFTRSI